MDCREVMASGSLRDRGEDPGVGLHPLDETPPSEPPQHSLEAGRPFWTRSSAMDLVEGKA
jgi:hypothetical protein